MAKQQRNRAKALTDEALRRLNAAIRQHEFDHNGATKYSLEYLGELTGLDPETVGKVLDRAGNDTRILKRCCAAFGITLTPDDYIPASQVTPPDIDPSFVGREEAIAHLQELMKRNAKVIVIQARGGVGKTTLARRFLNQEFDEVLEFPIAKETKDIASIESLLEEKLRQLGEEPGREFLVSCDRLKRKLQRDRIGILIDNLEPALDSAGRLIEPHRRYVEVLRILADSSVQSTTLITSRERLREASVTTETYLLKSLDLEAWKEFFNNRGLVTDTPALESLHNAYGGNAKAMEIICGAIAQDFDGDVDAYWQENQDDLFIERDLEDLVKEQFERLKQHNLDAYNLLCRMGCYRYQDVPTVPVEGLYCLMWDVPEKEHKRVVKVLRDRALIEFSDKYHWLHPIIRSESLRILRDNTEWEISNRKAAYFWTRLIQRITTVENALSAFESYFHYLSIPDFNAACSVILMRRISKYSWYDLDGGEALYNINRRFGFPRKTVSSINSVIQKVDNDFSLANLRLGLAMFHVITGRLRESIAESRKVVELVKTIELSKFKANIVAQGIYIHPNNKIQVESEIILERIKLGSLMTEALCHIYCLNLDLARCLLESVLRSEALPENEGYIIEAKFSLCMILSEYKPDEFNIDTANEVLSVLRNNDILLSEWCRGYGFLFMGETYKNLRDLDLAFELYEEAIAYSQESGYLQIQARAMTGLAQIFRMRKEFEKALSYHSEAERILDSIEAKCDLAESHYQLGLTYREMGNIDKSNFNIQKAIELFSEMEAPKQVERVKKALKGNSEYRGIAPLIP